MTNLLQIVMVNGWKEYSMQTPHERKNTLLDITDDQKRRDNSRVLDFFFNWRLKIGAMQLHFVAVSRRCTVDDSCSRAICTVDLPVKNKRGNVLIISIPVLVDIISKQTFAFSCFLCLFVCFECVQWWVCLFYFASVDQGIFSYLKFSFSRSYLK